MTSNLDEARRPLKSVGNLTATLPEREQESWGRKKTHQRAVTAVRISELSPAVVGGRVLGGDSGEASSDSATATAKKSDNFPKADDESREQISTPRSASQKESPFGDYNDSGSSSESSSTVVGISHEARESRTKRERTASDTRSAKTNALQYLESDSPVVSLEAIRQSLTYYKSSVSPMSTSPSSRSTTSSHQSSFFDGNHSDFPDHDTDRSTSPEHSPQDRTQYVRPPIQLSRRHRSYGTPEMPRGTADLPHISPKVLTSRASGQSYGYMPLPRAEKLLPTGYEQLAYKLASQGSHQAGPYLRPMYRRFGMLNHRLLLHLQDELCELEEQLHRLDTTDTQTRRLHNGVLPASRRAEALAGGELAWHKTDILGKIGFKLEQYSEYP